MAWRHFFKLCCVGYIDINFSMTAIRFGKLAYLTVHRRPVMWPPPIKQYHLWKYSTYWAYDIIWPWTQWQMEYSPTLVFLLYCYPIVPVAILKKYAQDLWRFGRLTTFIHLNGSTWCATMVGDIVLQSSLWYCWLYMDYTSVTCFWSYFHWFTSIHMAFWRSFHVFPSLFLGMFTAAPCIIDWLYASKYINTLLRFQVG